MNSCPAEGIPGRAQLLHTHFNTRTRGSRDHFQHLTPTAFGVCQDVCGGKLRTFRCDARKDERCGAVYGSFACNMESKSVMRISEGAESCFWRDLAEEKVKVLSSYEEHVSLIQASIPILWKSPTLPHSNLYYCRYVVKAMVEGFDRKKSILGKYTELRENHHFFQISSMLLVRVAVYEMSTWGPQSFNYSWI